MNCKNCGAAMTASVKLGYPITVTHCCQACKKDIVVSFEQGQEVNPFKKKAPITNSKVGHIITIRYGRHTVDYPIIYEDKSKWGNVYYYVPEWRKDTGQFLAYAASSLAIVSISKEASPLSPAHELMRKSIRLGKLSALCERLRYHYALNDLSIEKSPAPINTAYGTRFVLQDSYDEDFVDRNAPMAVRAAKKRNYYEKLRYDALVAAGVL